MAKRTVIPSLDDFVDYEGTQLGVSDWVAIEQDRIDAFAEATDDRQWIHCDVERARRESPWKKTVAHGYLTIALAPTLLNQLLRVEGWSAAINTGIDKMRLSSPVLAGSRVRMHARIKDVRSLSGGRVRVAFGLRFEVEGSAKPACTASVNYVYLP